MRGPGESAYFIKFSITILCLTFVEIPVNFLNISFFQIFYSYLYIDDYQSLINKTLIYNTIWW